MASSCIHAGGDGCSHALLKSVIINKVIKSVLKSSYRESTPGSWLEVWWCQIHIPNPLKGVLHIVTILTCHRGYWGHMSESSEARARKETISGVIAKYSTVLQYHIKLLLKKVSAAGYIHLL